MISLKIDMNNKDHKLSIIVPCYNCSKTLEQAVESIFKSNNLKIPFEVVMVNDGSTDNTLEIIKSLSDKHIEIKHFSHEINKGGAAARNTAINNASGDIIFCLDGDDICETKSIQLMVDYLIDNKLDGVMFDERRFFIGTNINKYNSHFNKDLYGQTIILEDLFSKKNLLINNFLYTKEAWMKCGGYPEGNDFDSQAFEFRFLTCNNTLQICPKTVYYHRQFTKNKSYFERAYEKGDFSRNYYLIFEEYLHIFSPKIREKILLFDIFKDNTMESDLFSFCQALYQENKDDFFIAEYKDYLNKNSMTEYCKNIVNKNSTEVTDACVLAINEFNQKDYVKSLDAWIKVSEYFKNKSIAMYSMIRCLLMINGNVDEVSLNRDYFKIMQSYLPKILNSRQTLFQLFKYKLNKLGQVFKKIWNIS